MKEIFTCSTIMSMNEIEIYKTPDGGTEVEVKFEKETVWLNQAQIAELFQRDRTVITKHINNAFKEGELDEKLVSANFAHTTKHGAVKGKTQQSEVKYYNLDVIISVGYRVKSKRGTQFRQWATQKLKEILLQGYSLNEKKLKQLLHNLQQLEVAVKTIQAASSSEGLQLPEAKGLLEILGNYTKSFILLNQYDGHNLPVGKLNENITYEIKYEEAKAAITELKKQLVAKKEAAAIFGNEKDEGFKSSLQSIIQPFGGQYVYPTIEEQAAHLLYFVIKNHSFTDGNKRIGSFLFVWFLEKNKHRFKNELKHEPA
ncbi:MAG: virulence protein RhuM/Fic/DOC family protein [Chitinophagaceae bacterium]|nr:virulence protein RhuM/Fic/DOC family protein [Chitinophagaceae bacterium]